MAQLFDPTNHVDVKLTLVGTDYSEVLPTVQINKFNNFDNTILKMREMAYLLFAARPEFNKIIFETMNIKFEILNEIPPEREKTLKELYPNSF